MGLGPDWWRPAGPESAETPSWARFVAEAFREAPTTAPRVPEGVAWDTGFATILSPFTELAAGRVAPALRAPLVEPAPILASFRDGLGKRLARLAARTLILELHQARKAGVLAGATPQARFADFVARTTAADNLGTILTRYPVLARIIGQCCVHAIEAFQELMARLATDRTALRRHLLGGVDPGPVVEISAEAGDGHQGGRSVRVLRFATGSRVVYKPRSLAVHQHFNDLVAMLTGRLGELAPATTPVLVRPGYGWSSFVAHAECADAAGVHSFYRRLGALLAVLYVLDATDIHYENVIARCDDPVVVDLETLFHPPPVLGRHDHLPDPALHAYDTSVSRVNLLPYLMIGDEVAVDLSGLGGDKGMPMPLRGFDFADKGTDRMRVVRVPAVMKGGVNRPVLHGADADPSVHLPDLLTGFRAGYRALLDASGAWTGTGGGLAGFGGDQIRVVVRATQLYATLLDESTHPDVLREAARRDEVFAMLKEGCPAPLAEQEIADLWRGDVPVFFTTAGGLELTGSDGQVAGQLASSGIDRVHDKLARLGDADLRRQEWVIKAMTASRDLRDPHHASPLGPSGRAGDPVPGNGDLLAAASSIGQRLMDTAERDGGRVNWLGLELVGDRFWQVGPLGAALGSGYLGVSLFLAHLGALTGRAGFTDLALRVVAPIPELLKRWGAREEDVALIGPGGFAGFGGIAYGLARIATVTGDTEVGGWMQEAVRLAIQSGQSAADPPELGVHAGVAGAVAALLAVHKDTGLPSAAAGARSLARVLATRDLPTSPGFADGAAGVRWALGLAGFDRAPVWSHGCDDLSWCRGVVGAALAGAPVRLPPAGLLPSDALCHGEGALLDAIASSARLVDQERLGMVYSRIIRYGPACATPGAVPSPGLLTGLSGIGYGLLRAGFSDRVPSILLLQPQADVIDHPSHQEMP